MKKAHILLASALILAMTTACKPSPTQSNTATPEIPPMPHGGTPVQVGEHEYHLELVNDRTEGKMTAYVLDEHAENPKVVAPTTFELIAQIDGEQKSLNFQPVPPEGGVIGSSFTASADWLKTATNFQAVIPSIQLGGKTFDNITFSFPEGTRHIH